MTASATVQEASRKDAADHAVRQAIQEFQAGRGREENFRKLYQRYHPALRTFFARKGCSAEECLDLTQEAFLGIYKGLESYRHEDRFEAWLYRVATTTFLKKLRASATVKRSAVEISQEELPEPRGGLVGSAKQLESLLDDERRRALEEAVRELPEQMRRCLTLRLYQELSYREIATALKLSVETVKAHLARARQKLRGHLSPTVLGLEEDENWKKT